MAKRGQEERLTESDPETPAPVAKKPQRARAAASAPKRQPDRVLAEPTEAEGVERETMDERDMSEDDFFAAFEESIDESVLPKLPDMPGFHICWLSLSHARDTIHNRQRYGYELIRPQMLPGIDKSNIKTGPMGDVIQINEMVAARIPISLWQRFMKKLHHDMPRQEEEKLRQTINAHKEQAEAMGARIIEGDGMAELGQRVPEPVFE